VNTEADKYLLQFVEGVSFVDEIRTYYSNVVQPLTLHLHIEGLGNGSAPTFGDFAYAYSLVSSRAFVVDAYHGLAMVPVADAFNHTVHNTIHLETNHDVCPVCGSWLECKHDRTAEDAEPTNDQDISLSRRESSFRASLRPPLSHEKLSVKDQPIAATHDVVKDIEVSTRIGPHSVANAAELNSDFRTCCVEADDVEEDICDMVTNAPIEANEEIFNTYGETLSNAELLVRYGFILDENEHDVVAWKLDELVAFCNDLGPSSESSFSTSSGLAAASFSYRAITQSTSTQLSFRGKSSQSADSHNPGDLSILELILERPSASCGHDWLSSQLVFDPLMSESESSVASSSSASALSSGASKRFCINSEGQISVSLWLFCVLFEIERSGQRLGDGALYLLRTEGPENAEKSGISLSSTSAPLQKLTDLVANIAELQRSLEQSLEQGDEEVDSNPEIDDSMSPPSDDNLSEGSQNDGAQGEGKASIFLRLPASSRRSEHLAPDAHYELQTNWHGRDAILLALLGDIVRTITMLCANKAQALSSSRGSAGRMTRLELGDLLDALPPCMNKTRLAMTEVLGERALLESCESGWAALERAIDTARSAHEPNSDFLLAI